MTNLIRAEFRRLFATRLWWSLCLTAVLLGGGLLGGMTLIGPENFDPPMPGIDTEPGVRSILGLLGFTAFVPAAVGTLAVTSEYRHRTVAVTFLAAPRRWQVLVAKLVVYCVLGTAYGALLAGSGAVALFAVSTAHGATLGLPTSTVLALLARIGLVMVVYMLVGVGVGAIARNQVVALAVVIGYLYMGETLLLMIPGVNAAYPVLPGGATASLTDFTYLADAINDQIGGTTVHLLAPAAGALLLFGYALAAALVAVVVPMRRDIT